MSSSPEPPSVKAVYTRRRMESFGARLRAAREAEKLSQLEVAAELGVTKGSLSAWENDKNYPQLDKFAQLCTLYRTTADRLLFSPEDGKPAHVGSPPPSEFVSPDHRRLVEIVAKITDRQRRGLLEFLDGWI